MTRITCKRPANLTGHIGSCYFVNGEGETEVSTLVAYFRRNPDRFDVHEDEPDEGDEGGPDESDDEGDGEPEPEGGEDDSEQSDEDMHPELPGENDTEDTEDGEPTEPDEGDGLDAMTVAELRSVAGDQGVAQAGSKAELIERLRASTDGE